MSDTWEEQSPILLDRNILPLSCDRCTLSENRLVDFPSYPVLRPRRIMIVGEFPSYVALRDTSPNPYAGHTWDVLAKVMMYLNVQHHHFSYSPLIRCWRGMGHVSTAAEYTTCMQHLQMFLAVTEAPVMIVMGSMPIKYLLSEDVWGINGKFRGIAKIRTSWKETPYESVLGVPVVPTEHPIGVQPRRCNSQTLFRMIAVDFMRAIGYAASAMSEYEKVAKEMNVIEYMKDYKKMLEEQNAQKTGKV